MRVLMLVIRYDTTDWATGFIPVWVTRLAGELDYLDVLALETGTIGELPPNVRVFSMGKERGAGRAALLRNFYGHALRLIPAADAVFVHMIPRYALLAAPLALPFGVPISLWYTHRHPSNDLKRALPLVRQVLTAVESSFPLQTDKLNVLGHGIDTAVFAPNPAISPITPPHIVHVARVQPIKNQDKLITALHTLPDAHALIIGAVPTGESPDYQESLYRAAHPLGGRVVFTGGLAAADVRAQYQQATAAVNLSPPGLFDKAALESMACGVPTLVSNPAFAPLLRADTARLLLDYPIDTGQLAERLRALLALDIEERRAMGARLRAAVIEAHSLAALIPRLAAALRQTV